MAYPPHAYHHYAGVPPPAPTLQPTSTFQPHASAYPPYPPPPPPPQQQQQQQLAYRAPPPVSQAEQFRSFFRGHLAPLVQNSRPIIQNLTQIAADHATDYAKAAVIAEEISRKILEVRLFPVLEGRRERGGGSD